ncbi:putative RNA-dependent RNA polymerase [Carnation cryptic virus 3]|uniref:putative RNA-dependent RNA polymerase n=1 Tax=Carnation cryptic virus 3 TaxID=1980625 RepID=UPI000A1A240D|nr:putative RNA-dependent RNA polymerase [Carnation cryptic virus 3]ARJ58791.1 putative RNA-dependent RNA polymerase [Carnation cryptic virus 3]
MHNINNYEFTDFTEEVEETGRTHHHVVRREPEVTYEDRFASQVLRHKYPVLYENIISGWSRSYYSGAEHMKSIMQYATPNIKLERLHDGVYHKAIANVRESLRSLPTVRAFNVLNELDLVPFESSSSAGYDYTGVKGPMYGENHERAIRRAKATLWSAIALDGEGIDHVIRTYVPDVGYTRTQLTDLREKMKVRGVWGRAFHYILLEGVVAAPLLEAFSSADTFFHIGKDPTVSVPYLLSTIKSTAEWITAIDWQSFDATVSRFEINAAFDIIEDIVSFPNFETEQAFEISRQLFIHKMLAAPDGKIYWIHKGIPSGSYFTSTIGSLVNRLRIEYMWILKFDRGPKICYTQGDDSLIGDDELFSPMDMTFLVKPYNWLINVTKSMASKIPEAVTFLGRTSIGGLNQRDLKRCLRLLILPEYPVTSGDISAYRAKAIWYDSGLTSEVLGEIARALRRKYGLAEKSKVPKYLIPWKG